VSDVIIIVILLLVKSASTPNASSLANGSAFTDTIPAQSLAAPKLDATGGSILKEQV
jgi:hypothetical protein